MNTTSTLYLLFALAVGNTALAQAPIANFTADVTSGCAPLTVSFTDSSSNTPLAWTWDFGDGSNSTAQNPVHIYTIAATYDVTLIATNGSGSDTIVKTAYITVTAIPDSAGAISGPSSPCYGTSVTYSITAVPGATSYTWTVPSGWIINSGQGSNTINVTTDSTSGNICVRACNSCGCSSFSCFAITVNPSPNAGFTYNGNQCLTGNNYCFTNIGTTGASYSWDFGDGAGASVLENPCYTYSSPGSYTVIQTIDNGSCTDVATVTVSVFAVPTATIAKTDVSCNGNCDGSATLNASGGTAPYTYMWSSGQTIPTINGLCAGTYFATVTDANGCTATDSAIILEPTPIIVATGSTDATCGNCDGTATATPSGGTSPYIYLWNDPLAQTTATAIGLCAGNYICTVTDVNGCIVTDTAVISGIGAVIFNLAIVGANCSVCDGSATANPANGTPPYTYLWSDSTTLQTADSLCAGSHALQIIDSTGCVSDTTFTVNNSGGLAAVISSVTDVSCNGGNDGTAAVSASNGTSPYTYLWNDSLAQTGALAINLQAGLYSVNVSDSAGCTFTVSATINEPAAALIASVASTNSGCGGTNGTASANATGGTSPYTYYWSTGDSSQNISGLAAGNYSVTVSDLNGCSDSGAAVIMQDTGGVVLTTTVYAPYYCGGNGYVTYNVSGGVAPYTYQWVPQPSYTSTWSNYASMQPGTYVLSVQGASGCADTVTAIIPSMCAPNTINGKVFDDFSANCTQDSGDYALDDWVVRADPGPVYANTMSDGSYSLYLDSGNYTISLVNNDQVFRTQVCPASPGIYSLSLTNTPSTTDNIDFSVLPAGLCPNMTVHFYHVGFSPCFCSWFRVYYENNGTAIATNAYIDVEFPPDVSPALTCTNGNWSGYATQWDSQNGNVYTFNLGSVPPGTEDYFYILTETSCSAVLGATKCVTAHIYPDSSCLPLDTVWDRSSVSVDGVCVGDSACFSITNTGDPGNGDMQGTSDYRIYENNILVYTGTFQLNGQDNIVACWPANSNTIRLEADQRPGHPGNSHPQDNVELCGTPSFTLGQIMLVPEDDNDDFIDMVCLPVTSSWDPNDKTVVPEGLTSSHFIDSTDQLEYRIRFQNTGTDTAFNIIIRDTISSALDLSSVVAGSGSHPYRMEMHESNVLQFIFDSILLPDSNVNEVESHGFVSFKINQNPGNPLGALIENTVGIYFDYNAPVITNTVFNTIGDIEALTTGMPQVYDGNYSIKVFPNPFHSTTTFEVEGIDAQPLTFELFNVIGERVKTIANITGSKFTVSRGDLSDGVYIYKMHNRNGLLGAGKLAVN